MSPVSILINMFLHDSMPPRCNPLLIQLLLSLALTILKVLQLKSNDFLDEESDTEAESEKGTSDTLNLYLLTRLIKYFLLSFCL